MMPKNEIEADRLTQTQDFLPSDGASCSPSSGVPANYIPFMEIPEVVHFAAETLNSYFERQGMREWQFAAIADRRLVNMLERERDRYKAALVQILKDGNRPMSMRVSGPSIIASNALQSPENETSQSVGCHLNRGCLRLESLCPSDATACSRVFGDCDCDEQIPSDDYVCKKCELDVTICAECHTIIAGCECGHCPAGSTFHETD